MFSFRKKDANPYAGRKSLFVRVACAEDLIRADVFGGSDPYAKVYWNNLYAGKTPVINDTLNPVWERDSSVFEIPIDTSNDEEFEVSLKAGFVHPSTTSWHSPSPPHPPHPPHPARHPGRL